MLLSYCGAWKIIHGGLRDCGCHRRCIHQARKMGFEIGIVFEDLLKARTGTEEIENVRDSNSHSTDAGTPTALSIVDCNPAEASRGHSFHSRSSDYFLSIAGRFIGRDLLNIAT